MEDAIAESDDLLVPPGQSINDDFTFMSDHLSSNSSVQFQRDEASKQREERQAEAMTKVLIAQAKRTGC